MWSFSGQVEICHLPICFLGFCQHCERNYVLKSHLLQPRKSFVCVFVFVIVFVFVCVFSFPFKSHLQARDQVGILIASNTGGKQTAVKTIDQHDGGTC